MTTRSEREEMLEFLSQGNNFETVLKRNMFDLCQRTVNMNKLATFLRLDSDQIATIMHSPSSFQRAALLYDLILKRNTQGSQLLEGWDETGNEHLLPVLVRQVQALQIQTPRLPADGGNEDETPTPTPPQQPPLLGPQTLKPSLSADNSNDDDDETTSYSSLQELPISVPGPGPAPPPDFKRDFAKDSVVKIGYGNFGLVYSADITTNTNNNAKKLEKGRRAIKILRLRSNGDDKIMEREVKILEDLKDGKDPRAKFIVRIERHWSEPGEGKVVDNPEEFLKPYPFYRDIVPAMKVQLKGLFFIQMEYCTLGTLDQWVEQNNIRGQQPPEQLNQCRRWFAQVIEGVTLLHSLKPHPIWHRDLKPDNILLAAEEDPTEIEKGNNIVAKIADFGQARYFPKGGQPLTTKVGNDFYKSPEIIGRKSYSEKTDIYSLGVILVTLLRPMIDEQKDMLKDYYEFFYEPRHQVPAEFSTSFPKEADQARKMLKVEPGERPSAQEVLDWCKSHQFN